MRDGVLSSEQRSGISPTGRREWHLLVSGVYGCCARCGLRVSRGAEVRCTCGGEGRGGGGEGFRRCFGSDGAARGAVPRCSGGGCCNGQLTPCKSLRCIDALLSSLCRGGCSARKSAASPDEQHLRLRCCNKCLHHAANVWTMMLNKMQIGVLVIERSTVPEFKACHDMPEIDMHLMTGVACPTKTGNNSLSELSRICEDFLWLFANKEHFLWV